MNNSPFKLQTALNQRVIADGFRSTIQSKMRIVDMLTAFIIFLPWIKGLYCLQSEENGGEAHQIKALPFHTLQHPMKWTP